MTTRNSLNRSLRSRLQRGLICLVLAAVCVLSATHTLHATQPVLTGRANVTVSAVGDIDYAFEFKTKTSLYTELKSKTTNFQLLARSIGLNGKSWVKQADLNGKFDDMKSAIELTYNTPGGARPVRGSRWVVSLGGRSDLQVVTCNDDAVTLMGVQDSGMGVGTMIMNIELPEGAANVKFNSSKCELAYDFEPKVEQGDSVEFEMEVDHKEVLMTALAKCYANRQFNNMWAARSVFENTGDQTLHDYRVRFRVADMGSWSGWQRTSHVYPGQSVVDPFFPIFDLDKMMALNGTRPAMIEVEYEYKDNDGEKACETDSFPVKLLSRNQVVFSSLPADEVTGYHDMFDFGPALLTAFTTPGDPVMQQLAGRVNGIAAQAAGRTIAAGARDEDAFVFIAAMWAFVNENNIAYQSPPGVMTGGKFGQHIKYGRDVLQNRAGTCIDLAIMWASVAEATGLDPLIALIPGHAYPVIRLPQSGKLIALESTMIGRPVKEAVEVGMKRLEELKSQPHYLVDIKARRRAGIVSLDLPNVSQDHLEDLGYRFNLVNPNAAQANQNRQVTQNQQPRGRNFPPSQLVPNGPQVNPNQLVGTWVGAAVVNGIESKVVLVLNANGGFGVTYRDTDQAGNWEQETYSGVWSKNANGQLSFTWGSEVYEYEFNFDGEYLYIEATDHPIIICMSERTRTRTTTRLAAFGLPDAVFCVTIGARLEKIYEQRSTKAGTRRAGVGRTGRAASAAGRRINARASHCRH